MAFTFDYAMIHSMKKLYGFILIMCLVCTCIFTTACSRQPEPVSKTGCYFDTVITITLYCEDAEHYIDECFAMADKYENLFSTTKEGSDIYILNHSQGEAVTLEPETIELIEAGIKYAKDSDGTFDLTVGNLSSIWQDAIKKKEIPPQEDVKKALSTISWKNIIVKGDTVRLENDVRLDLGGIAKGYIADKMKEYLLKQGITCGLINLGGNILAVGPKATEPATYAIAIQKPFSKDGEAIASVKITDQSVVTSGTYQRYFEESNHIYHHILDLNTGYPCENDLYSVTIICDKSIDGDALSTTVFLMGLDNGLAYVENLPDTESIFITKDGKLHTTSGIGKTIPYQEL